MLLCCYAIVAAQQSMAQNSLKPKSEIRKTNCEENNLVLINLDQSNDRNDLIIIISHSAKNEKKVMGARRLHNAVTFLTKSFEREYNRTANSIITAKGATTDDKAYLDFFVKGQLELRIFFDRNRDLRLPPCVFLFPKEKPCSTDFEKMYYPCKGK
jgi:hypothetical protein